MKLVQEGRYYVVKPELPRGADTYAAKDLIKAAKFRWTGLVQNHWATDDVRNAVALWRACEKQGVTLVDDAMRAHLEDTETQRQATVVASRAEDADIDIPAPAGLAYRPFQKAGVAFALNAIGQHKAVLFGDSMGLGKTWETIGTLVKGTLFPVIIVCPSSLRLNWKNELLRLIPGVRVMVYEGTHGTSTAKATTYADSESPGAPVAHVVNYDILESWLPFFTGINLKALVFDEIQYLKNQKTKRAKACLALSKAHPVAKFGLSGTPIPNRVKELLSPLNILGVRHLIASSDGKFLYQYCGPETSRFGTSFDGHSNLPELQDRLRSTIMIRRLFEQVMTEIPTIQRQVIELPANGAKPQVDAERASYEAQQDHLILLQAAVELARLTEDDLTYREAIRALQSGWAAAFAEISKQRQRTAVAKIPYLVSYAKDLLEETGKVVIMAWHHEVVNTLREELADYHPAVLTGQTPLAQRQDAVERFQNDPTCQVFIGTIPAAGVGITLTAAQHMIFAELSWVPGDMSQAERRILRIGQTGQCLIHLLVLEGSLDATMARTIIRKQEAIEGALDTEHGTVSADLDIPILPILPRKEYTPTVTEQTSVGEGVSRKQVEEEAIQITPEDIQEVHQKLQYLASVCNYASTHDATGFNKVDAYFGHKLAALATLTPRQAIIGQKMVKKYHRQLRGV